MDRSDEGMRLKTGKYKALDGSGGERREGLEREAKQKRKREGRKADKRGAWLEEFGGFTSPRVLMSWVQWIPSGDSFTRDEAHFAVVSSVYEAEAVFPPCSLLAHWTTRPLVTGGFLFM